MSNRSRAAPLGLTGERLAVAYRVWAGEEQARELAEEICIEQTIEFPFELVTSKPIREQIVGRIERFAPAAGGGFEATISYPVEAAGSELTQLLNLILGNTSLKPGISVERLALAEGVLASFTGPRFGRAGLRQLLGVPHRPLLCTALKPMGLSAIELADLAYRCALGGIDLIKDDHGLTDQPFCPFDERVARCADAVARANSLTNSQSLYVPNITTPRRLLPARLKRAKQAGAGGLLIAPGLVGFDALQDIAADDTVALPILCHPAFLGGFTARPDHGFSPAVLLGQLARLAGADATIFPHCGGRFALSADQCRALAIAVTEPLGALPPIFAVPAGGIDLARVPELLSFYGPEVILLIGGDLRRGPDLVARCARFRALVENPATQPQISER